MINRFRRLFKAPAADKAAGAFDVVAAAELTREMAALNASPYLYLAENQLISVFDDLKYDRADIDMLSPAMRNYAIEKIEGFGFKQISGAVLEHQVSGARILIPKFHAQGASPFDITRYTPRRAGDFYLLTPTQTACHIIDRYDVDEAVGRIKDLIVRQPINLYRLMDYLEKTPKHQAFMGAIGHLKFVQREAVSSEPLCRRRALG